MLCYYSWVDICNLQFNMKGVSLNHIENLDLYIYIYIYKIVTCAYYDKRQQILYTPEIVSRWPPVPT